MRIKGRGISLDPRPVMNAEACRLSARAELSRLLPERNWPDEAMKEAAEAYWRRYTAHADAGWNLLYYERTGAFDERFVPSDAFYAEIDRVLNSPVPACGLSDKLLYPALFPDIAHPKTLFHKTGGCLFNVENEPITEEEALRLVFENGGAVLKQPVFTCGGAGVIFASPDEPDTVKQAMALSDRLLAQAPIRQHPELARFNPASVNTVRAMTYLRENGEAVLLASVLRMGGRGSRVDNVSSGGCACGILPDGRLSSLGCSNELRRISAHPSGEAFEGSRVPGFAGIDTAVKRLHRRLPMFALLAWDIAVGEDGEPVLIEVNIGGASIDFMQICCGPLFGELTEEVLERVYRLPLIG